MLSSVLNSAEAIQVNIAIMRIFTSLRNSPESEKILTERMNKLEKENHKAFEILSTRLDSVEEVIFVTSPAKKKKIGLN